MAIEQKVYQTVPPQAFGSNIRGHDNLEKLALAFNRLNAVDDNTYVSVSLIAEAVEMDRSHVIRILDSKPGFVKVISFVGGTRKMGYYYLANEFMPTAVKQGARAYPHSTYSLFREDMPKAISRSDGSVGMKPTAAKEPDIRLENPTGGYWPPVIIEPINAHPDRMQVLFSDEWLSLAASNIKAYQTKPSLSLSALDSIVSNLLSLRAWLLINANDPEASIMLGSDNV